MTNSVQGYVDVYDEFSFSGWCWNSGATAQSVALTINNEFVRTFPAPLLRDDVRLAGIGNGLCGFHFALPARLFERGIYLIRIEDALTRTCLENGSLAANNGKIFTIDKNSDAKTLLNKCAPLSIKALCDIYFLFHKPALDECVDMIIEKLAHLPLREFLAYCYCIVLGRFPDLEGYRDILIDIGKRNNSYREFIYGMMSSDEFNKNSNIRLVEERIRNLTLPDMFLSKN